MKTTITNHRIENYIESTDAHSGTRAMQKIRQRAKKLEHRNVRRSERRDIEEEMDATNLPEVWAQEEVA